MACELRVVGCPRLRLDRVRERRDSESSGLQSPRPHRPGRAESPPRGREVGLSENAHEGAGESSRFETNALKARLWLFAGHLPIMADITWLRAARLPFAGNCSVDKLVRISDASRHARESMYEKRAHNPRPPFALRQFRVAGKLQAERLRAAPHVGRIRSALLVRSVATHVVARRT